VFKVLIQYLQSSYCIFSAVCCLLNGFGIRIAQRFGGLFSSNKSVPGNSKKVFKESRLPKNEEIGGFFVFSGSEL
jgi:hypothetical protein